MRYQTIAALLGAGLALGSTLSVAETALPAVPPRAGAADPFERTLRQMESVIARLRATDDPGQRHQLLQEQAHNLRRAMRLVSARGPGVSRSAPTSVPNTPSQPRWTRRQGTWGPAPPHARTEPMGPSTLHSRGRHGAPYVEMEQQLALMQRQLDEQQQILDEILKYKEPFERLLQEQGITE